MDIQNYFGVYTPTTPLEFTSSLPDIQNIEYTPSFKLEYNTNYLDNDYFPIEEDIIDSIPKNSNNLSFYELVKLEHLPVKIVSGYRGKNDFRHGLTASGKVSNHSKLDDKGNPMAYDIQPSFGKTLEDFNKLRKIMLGNSNVVNWLLNNNKGILEEVTPLLLKRYGGTGPNFHIGPDKAAVENLYSRLTKALDGTKLPEFGIYTPNEQKINDALLTIPSNITEYTPLPEMESLEELPLEEEEEKENNEVSNNNITFMEDDIRHKFGHTANKFLEFAQVMIPIFLKALDDNNIETSKDNLYNLVRLAALESNYGLDPRGKHGFNLSGIKWYKGCPYRKTLGLDGEYYVDFDNLELYANYKVKVLNNKYNAFDAKDTIDFVERLHGNNPTKSKYSSSEGTYLATLSKMNSLNLYLA